MTFLSARWYCGHFAPYERPNKMLTDKMIAAAAYYMTVERHKTNAYRHAFNCEGMNPRSVHVEASRLFSRPDVKAIIDTWRAQITAKCHVSAQWVLERAKLLADFNLNKFLVVEGDGKAYYDFSTATDDDWYCITEYCVDVIPKGRGDDKYEVERVRVRSESRIAALRLVGEHVQVQAFKQQMEVTGQVLNMDTEQYKKAREEMLRRDEC